MVYWWQKHMSCKHLLQFSGNNIAHLLGGNLSNLEWTHCINSSNLQSAWRKSNSSTASQLEKWHNRRKRRWGRIRCAVVFNRFMTKQYITMALTRQPLNTYMCQTPSYFDCWLSILGIKGAGSQLPTGSV